jgi:hypothetical protein
VGRDSEDVGSAGVRKNPHREACLHPALGARSLSHLGGGHPSHTPGTGIRKPETGYQVIQSNRKESQ